jgi:DNA-binding Xre family transcriptional regulator/predicted DNA-binding transcriptional regulator AlpA
MYYFYVKQEAQQMIKIKIAELAAKRHNVTTAYQLQNFLGISPSIASRLWKGDFDKIGINTINKLCYRLDCQPSDFLEYVRLPQTKEDPFHDGYVTKKQRAEGITGAQKAKGWGNPRNKKAKDEPQTDNILLNNSLFDNAQSNNTKSENTKLWHGLQLDNTELGKTQSVSDNERLLTTADIAERLGLSKKSVTDYINKGILPTIQPKGARTPHFVKESDYPAFELYYRNLTGKV